MSVFSERLLKYEAENEGRRAEGYHIPYRIVGRVLISLPWTIEPICEYTGVNDA